MHWPNCESHYQNPHIMVWLLRFAQLPIPTYLVFACVCPLPSEKNVCFCSATEYVGDIHTWYLSIFAHLCIFKACKSTPKKAKLRNKIGQSFVVSMLKSKTGLKKVQYSWCLRCWLISAMETSLVLLNWNSINSSCICGGIGHFLWSISRGECPAPKGAQVGGPDARVAKFAPELSLITIFQSSGNSGLSWVPGLIYWQWGRDRGVCHRELSILSLFSITMKMVSQIFK